MFDATVILGTSKPYEVVLVKKSIIPPRESATISFLPNSDENVT
jgi:hypothetical protein